MKTWSLYSDTKCGRTQNILVNLNVLKTFWQRILRAKAGGRQSTKDASGKFAKSAGAQIRRHNEVCYNVQCACFPEILMFCRSATDTIKPRFVGLLLQPFGLIVNCITALITEKCFFV